jgi:hypothetical protein
MIIDIKYCKTKKRSSVLGVLLTLMVFLFSSVALAQDDFQDSYQVTPFDQSQDILDQEYEDLVLAVFAERVKLSEGIFALQRGDIYYLPIKALASVFDFYIEDLGNPTVAKGFVISEDETFEVNLDEQFVSYRGRRTSIDDLAFVDPSVASEDIFIASEILNQIWPMQLSVDMGALLLRVDPDNMLPFQMALERKQRQKNFKNRRQERIDFIRGVDDLPFIAKPYQLIGKPSLDIDAETGFDARLDSMEYRAAVTGVQDLGYASADYSLSYAHRNGSLQKPDNLRLRFRRQNIYPNALPLDLEDTQWGDVRLANRDLISAGSGGRGLIFTNDINNFETEFDEITVDGIGRPGWEVELYINDELINFGVVDERGEYRFEDVVITFGNNEVKVVLYGPQGQVEERIENYFYQSNVAQKGQFIYSGGIVDAERDLIEIDPRDISKPEGLAANFYGAYGFAKQLTGFFSANTIRDRDSSGFGFKEERRNYVTTGVIGSYASTLAQAELYKEINGGEAIDLKTLSDFKGFKVNTKVAAYNDFESPDARSGDNRKKFEAEFNVRKLFRTVIGSLGFDVGSDYLKRESGLSTQGITTRQSLGIQGARFTNSTRSIISNNSHTTSTGRLSSTVRRGNWRYRNSFNYRFFPELDATSIQLEARYGTRKDISYAMTFDSNFDTQEKIVGFQIAKDFDKFLGSFEADWSSKFGVGFLVRASTALGPYDYDGGYIMQSEPLRSAGPISGLVYLDKDYDGVYSEGDEPVPGTKVRIGPRSGKAETDEQGRITEINTSLGSRLGVAVSTKSIDDPYLTPANDGYAVYPRAGVAQYVELPLIETGAIDGTLSYANGDPIPGLMLEIMNSDADIVASSRTGVDGYFTFERIPPGSYTIRAAPDSGLTVPFKYIDLTPDNLFQFGIAMTADDLNQGVESGIETEVADNAGLSVKNILSIAKGFKENGRFVRAANASPAVPANFKSSAIAAQKVSSVPGAVSVRMVRVGKHPDKVRLVMDLTAPIRYEVKQDKANSLIIVDMPNSGWTAKAEYMGSKASRLRGYHIEALEGGGTRLVLQTAAAASIGDYGLLRPHKGKKDRFYLDIR